MRRFVVSAAIVGAIVTSAPIASAQPPRCDQPDVTRCSWTVEIDGRMLDLPGCAYEDGNTDGRPCLWFDPDTGAAFLVDSRNYKRTLA